MNFKKIITICALWLAGIIAGIQFAKFALLIGIIQSYTGISEIYASWLLSSLGIMGILFGTTAGIIVSKFSSLKLVIIALFIASCTSLIQAIFPIPSIMLFIRILEGVSQLIIVSAAPTAMLKITPKRYQQIVMTIWGTFFGVAFLIVGSFKEPLLNIGGWKIIFFIHATAACVIAIILLYLLRVTEFKHIPYTNRESSNLINQHKIIYSEIGSLFPGVLFGCHTLMYLVFLTYIPIYFRDLFPENKANSEALIILMPLFSLIGTFLSGWILNFLKKSPLELLKYFFFLTAILCSVLILTTSAIQFVGVSLVLILSSEYCKDQFLQQFLFLAMTLEFMHMQMEQLLKWEILAQH